MLRIGRRWSARVAFASMVLVGALAFAQAPPAAPPDERAAEASLPKRYPVVPLAEREKWDDVMPQIGRHVSVWNGHIVIADTKGIDFFDLQLKPVKRIPFPAKAILVRPLRPAATPPFEAIPVRDFPGLEYNDVSTKPASDRVVFLDETGESQASFVVASRWQTALSPHAAVVVKHGEVGLLVEGGAPVPNTAGYTAYDRKGGRLYQVERESKLFFADVNDSGYTLAFEKEKAADPAPSAFGPAPPDTNRVVGFALLNAAGKVLLRERATRVDQLVFTPSGRHAVVGTFDKVPASEQLRRRTRFFDLTGKLGGELKDMGGMLFGQVAGDDDLILTRCRSGDEPWRWVEVLVVDCASGKVRQKLTCDVTATRVEAFLSKDGTLFVYFEPYALRASPAMAVYSVATGATLFTGEMFLPPPSKLLHFVSYDDREQVLLSSPHRLWLTSPAIVQRFAGRSQTK